jgi:HEPN domain-containing protein
MPKPLDPVIQRFVSEWLKKADLDLQLAEYLQVEDAPFYEAIAFHSQQATEKYLKAVLVKNQVESPETHNIPWPRCLQRFCNG